MKKTGLIVAALVLVITSCNRGAKENTDIIISQEINMEHKYLNFEDSKREGKPHSGKYFSSVDSTKQFGVGYEYELADTLKNRNLKVYVSAWVRERDAPLQGHLILALSTSKGTVTWQALKYKNTVYVPNEWVQIKDSVSFSSNQITDSLVKIGVVAEKLNGQDGFDVDDLNVTYKFSK